jgi:hypothetical protein
MASSTDLDLELGATRRWSDGPAPAQQASRRQAAAAAPVAASKATPAEDERESDAAPPRRERVLMKWIRESQSWLSSLVVHMVLLIVLAVWFIPGVGPAPRADLKLTHQFSDQDELTPDILPELDETPPVEVQPLTDVPSLTSDMQAQELALTPADDLAVAAAPEPTDFATNFTESFLEESQGFAGTALSGRGVQARGALVRSKGGNKASEEAVEMALAWLAAHQLPNGAWSFNHQPGPCNGRCSAPGANHVANAFNGGTAIALLPFLGAGQTHLAGQYRDNAKRGFYYLTQSMQVKNNVGSLWEEGGRMYSHGLGAIALCECYGMTRDADLGRPAQLAINYIHAAQDPLGGGWRYTAQQPGDTSVVGWQVMALKSGHMAYLQVNPAVVKKAYLFLDFVQADEGAAYGYTGSGNGEATSAVGLLCRMYLGWKKENPALGRGIGRLLEKGPDKANMYYNYYATQAIFQYTGGEGSLWREWNEKMRDFLISTQAREGHEKGSWFLPGDGHNTTGGRLYVTAMATMILEVYYRHMPIYQEKAIEEEFPE